MCYTNNMQPEDNKDTWQAPDGKPAGVYTESAPQSPAVSAEQPLSPETQPATEPHEGDEELIRWQGIEHIYREKDPLWYIIFAIVVLGFILLAIFVVKSWTFAILVPVMAAALVVYAMRPPAVIDYTLSRKGLHANDRLYSFDDFKEFGLVQDAEEHSVMLMPRKRFQPGVTVYFPEEAGEAIIDMLASRLPMRDVKLDSVDRLIRMLRI